MESMTKPEVLDLLQRGRSYQSLDALPMVYVNKFSRWFGFSVAGEPEGATVAGAGLVHGGGAQTGLGVDAGFGAACAAPSRGIVTLYDLAVARERLELLTDATMRYAEEIKLT
jgi:hypothetical protein